eukprot:jgi/Astpho2/364/Aster-x0902
MAGYEKVLENQKFFQNAHALTHLKRPGADRITTVMIPLGFASVGGFLLARGLWHMMHGTGKLE